MFLFVCLFVFLNESLYLTFAKSTDNQIEQALSDKRCYKMIYLFIKIIHVIEIK